MSSQYDLGTEELQWSATLGATFTLQYLEYYTSLLSGFRYSALQNKYHRSNWDNNKDTEQNNL